MRHGYTNSTERVDDAVLKRYAGPTATDRARAEQGSLTNLAGHFPVPELLATSADSTVTRFVPGQHGQDLIDAGMASAVLAECGRVLRELHALDPATPAGARPGDVIQHGDFGPNNVIFSTDPVRASAVLDWEFSGVGSAITDVAWCEWIVRMHHPAASGSLRHFFASYGTRPTWHERRAEMLDHCGRLADFCRHSDAAHPGIALWHERRARTASWPPLPDDAG